jgi:hypothetical protein
MAHDYPAPPSLHWAGLLLLHLATLGLFTMFWIFRQALWVRRIDPASRAVYVLAACLLLSVIPVLFPLPFREGTLAVAGLLARSALVVAWVWAYLWMRRSIESAFDLTLSGVLTVLFGVFYLQYHLRRIARGGYEPEQRGLLR